MRQTSTQSMKTHTYLEDMERSSKNNMKDTDATNTINGNEMKIDDEDDNNNTEEAEETTTIRLPPPPSLGNSASSSPRHHQEYRDDCSRESERLTGFDGEKAEQVTPAVAIGLTAKGYQRRFATHEYKDRSNEILEPTTKFERDAIKLYYSCQVTGPFPFKLQVLLRLVEMKNLQHIIGWQPHGRSFSIRNPTEFESGLMTSFFAQTQLTSFRRQLNLYDFKRITHGPDSGSYYHELFLRGKPLHAYRIKRTKVKGTKYRSTSSPEDEPDFYSMPALPPCYDPLTEQQDQQQQFLMGGHILVDQIVPQSGGAAPPQSQPQPPHQQSWKTAAATNGSANSSATRHAASSGGTGLAPDSFSNNASIPIHHQQHPQYPQQYSSTRKIPTDADGTGMSMGVGSSRVETTFSSAGSVPPPGTSKNSALGSSSFSPNNYVSPPGFSSGGGIDNTSINPTTTNQNGNGNVSNIVAGGHHLVPSMMASTSSNTNYGFPPNTTAVGAYPHQHQQQQHLIGSSSANFAGSNQQSTNNVLATLEQLRMSLGLGNNNDQQQRNQHDLINEAIYSLLVNMALNDDTQRAGFGATTRAGNGIDLSALLILIQQEQQRRRQQQEQRDRQITELLASLSARNNSAPRNQRFDNAFHTSPVVGDNLMNYNHENSQQNTNYYAAPVAGAPRADGGSVNALLLSALLEQTYPSISDNVPGTNGNGAVQTSMGRTPYFYDEAHNSRNGVGTNDCRGNGINGLGYSLGRNFENLETGRSSTEGQGFNGGVNNSGGLNLMHIMSAYNVLHGNHGPSAGMSGGNLSYSTDHMTRSSDMFNPQGNIASTEQHGVISGSGKGIALMRTPLHIVGSNTAYHHHTSGSSYPDDRDSCGATSRKDVQMQQSRVSFENDSRKASSSLSGNTSNDELPYRGSFAANENLKSCSSNTDDASSED